MYRRSTNATLSPTEFASLQRMANGSAGTISSPFAGDGKIAVINFRIEPSNAPSVEPSALSIKRNPPNVRNRRSASMPAALGSSKPRSPLR